MQTNRPTLLWLGISVLMALAAAACGSDDQIEGSADPAATADDAPPEAAAEESADSSATGALGDGSLGVVEVPPDEAIQIRSLNSITGDVAYLGTVNQRGVEMAIADFGPVHGFEVDMGAGLDDLCSADGGQAAAQRIVADERVVGVVGASCSAASTAASPLVTAAGIAMIAPSNTSPMLTSDLSGNEGANYSSGYFRTSHNGLVVGHAISSFLLDDLGLTRAAAIHDGDPYTQGIAQAFADSFSASGGTVTLITAVNKEETDMVPALTEIAAGSPEALFFPIFQPAGDFVAGQARSVAGLEDLILLTDAALLVDGFMSLPQSEGIFISGPDLRFGTNTNQSTAVTAAELLERYEQEVGEPPSSGYLAHSYDATTLLLEAVTAASHIDTTGTLVIDRAGLRQYLHAVDGYRGIIGEITCDDFGDCGSRKVTIIEHLDHTDIETGKNNIVFEFAP